MRRPKLRRKPLLKPEKAIQEYLAKAEALRRQREEELAKLKATIRELQAQLKQLRQGKVPSTTLTPTITLTPTSTPRPLLRTSV